MGSECQTTCKFAKRNCIYLLHAYTHVHDLPVPPHDKSLKLEGTTVPRGAQVRLRRQRREAAAIFTSARRRISAARAHNGTPWSMGHRQSNLFPRGRNNGFETRRGSILHHAPRTGRMARAQFERLSAIGREDSRLPVRGNPRLFQKVASGISRSVSEGFLDFRNSFPRKVRASIAAL